MPTKPTQPESVLLDSVRELQAMLESRSNIRAKMQNLSQTRAKLEDEKAGMLLALDPSGQVPARFTEVAVLLDSAVPDQEKKLADQLAANELQIAGAVEPVIREMGREFSRRHDLLIDRINQALTPILGQNNPHKDAIAVAVGQIAPLSPDYSKMANLEVPRAFMLGWDPETTASFVLERLESAGVCPGA